MEFSIQTNDYNPIQLTEFAMSILRGNVFCSWMVNGMDKEQLETIFIPLTKQPLKPVNLSFTEIEADDVVHVFQDKEKSFFNKPNGYPSFKSCRGLKQKYVKLLMDEMARLQQAGFK